MGFNWNWINILKLTFAFCTLCGSLVSFQKMCKTYYRKNIQYTIHSEDYQELANNTYSSFAPIATSAFSSEDLAGKRTPWYIFLWRGARGKVETSCQAITRSGLERLFSHQVFILSSTACQCSVDHPKRLIYLVIIHISINMYINIYFYTFKYIV